MKVSVNINEPVADSSLQALVVACKFGRYPQDTSLPVEGVRRLVFANSRSFQSRADAQWLVARSRDDAVVGLLLFRLSGWDTEHFGYPVAMIDSLMVMPYGQDQQLEIARELLKHFALWCESAKVRFVSTRVPALDLPAIHALEEQGFRFMESWVYNKLDLSRDRMPPEPPPSLRLSAPDDMAVMLEYSKAAFATQRFHADWHIDPVKADSLYQKWIETAFADPGQLIAVLESGGSPKAFMVYYKSDLRAFVGRQYAMWKMALLDPASRGQGLGTQFFAALAQHHLDEGLDVIDSGLSMRNLPSLNLHNKNRFKIIATMITYHKWTTA